jgi:REP element-mobilizing transposase RayT
VFAAVNDYRYYLANLKEQKEALNIRVFAYCLMTNHVHLIVQPDGDPVSVSRLMRVLAARQTRYTNKVEHLTGTHRFVDAIEAKIGRRIEARAPGRPQRNAAMAKK